MLESFKIVLFTLVEDELDQSRYLPDFFEIGGVDVYPGADLQYV